MLIDWFTVGAQVVNFLVLLYLLKRFLYGPIIQAMEGREQGIAERLQSAAQSREEARQLNDEYRNRLAELEELGQQRLEQVEQQAAQRRQELLEQARGEAEQLRKGWADAVSREQLRFLAELKKRTGAEVLNISRKSLHELTGGELQPSLIAVFLQRLQQLKGTDREEFRNAARNAELLVRTPLGLGQQPERQLTAALQEASGTTVRVVYAADPEMPLGIEVSSGEYRLSWGIDSYFETLETSVSALLAQVRGSSAALRGGEP